MIYYFIHLFDRSWLNFNCSFAGKFLFTTSTLGLDPYNYYHFLTTFFSATFFHDFLNHFLVTSKILSVQLWLSFKLYIWRRGNSPNLRWNDRRLKVAKKDAWISIQQRFLWTTSVTLPCPKGSVVTLFSQKQPQKKLFLKISQTGKHLCQSHLIKLQAWGLCERLLLFQLMILVASWPKSCIL